METEAKPGTLYVVSTPLGNLEDITLRALRILKEAGLIAAESREHTRILCRQYGIGTRLTSYNQHNQRARTPELIAELKSGVDVALVTNAGTPGVSDPGVFLAGQALKENIRVVPVPGPSAVTSALSVSGLRGEKFLFWGFLPNRSSRRRKEIKALASLPYTIVFFEAPHRLKEMLLDLADAFGNRPMVLVREMTKVFEEVKGGSAGSILGELEPDHLRGEFTIVVAGRERDQQEPLLDGEVRNRIRELLKSHGMSVRDIAQKLSTETGMGYRDIYRATLAVKKRMQLS